MRFAVTAPFKTAGYCHCKRCQRRSGTLWTLNAMVDADAFKIVSGADALETWQPPDGHAKAFCAHCGGHIYSSGKGTVSVRLGAVDGDPGVRPEYHQRVETAAVWEPLPDDGLPRFEGPRPS